MSDGQKTTRKGLLKGNEIKQGFKPGQSGNPGGRPKGLANLVRGKTKDGAQLVQIMHGIATGKLSVRRTVCSVTGETRSINDLPSHRDRIAAVEWLADRGFGKTAVLLEHTGKDGGPVETTNASVTDLLAELVKRGEQLPTCAQIPILQRS